MRLLSTITLIAGLSLVAGTASLSAQAPKRNVPDSLVSKAKVSEDSARALALKHTPGTVQSIELEHEKGHLLWEFMIQRSGHKNATEVEVNAMTGHVAVKGSSTKPKSTTHHSS
jgi:uncharacterized membrane protein YkoI